MLDAGGNAVDAAITAQAVIATVMPQAAGLGGDLLALVHAPDGTVHAINGTGSSPATAPREWATDGGSSVTVPGLVDGWHRAHSRWGRLPLATTLASAVALAGDGYPVDSDLVDAATIHRPRMERYGGGGWSLLSAAREGVGTVWRQPELAELLSRIADEGPSALYRGSAAESIAAAVAATGGTLSAEDLAAHTTATPPAVSTPWNDGRLFVQPPSSQGILLAMAARWLERSPHLDLDRLDHLLVEVTEAAFAHRDSIGGPASDLLEQVLDVDEETARGLGGPRAYLHTAGVAAADSDGLVVSSLISVFDDFGSAVLVPELGIVLGNRAAGFTSGDNAPRPGARPVHTLAPALVVDADGAPLALATPGADGQVQTLLQVLAGVRFGGMTLSEAIARPRWRSENGRLLIEPDHPETARLAGRGHLVTPRDRGDGVFGAVVAAGLSTGGATARAAGQPFAEADWRRGVTCGVTGGVAGGTAIGTINGTDRESG